MQNRFHAALNTLPSPLQTLLTDIVCADTFGILIGQTGQRTLQRHRY